MNMIGGESHRTYCVHANTDLNDLQTIDVPTYICASTQSLIKTKVCKIAAGQCPIGPGV